MEDYDIKEAIKKQEEKEKADARATFIDKQERMKDAKLAAKNKEHKNNSSIKAKQKVFTNSNFKLARSIYKRKG